MAKHSADTFSSPITKPMCKWKAAFNLEPISGFEHFKHLYKVCYLALHYTELAL